MSSRMNPTEKALKRIEDLAGQIELLIEELEEDFKDRTCSLPYDSIQRIQSKTKEAHDIANNARMQIGREWSFK